MKQDILLGTQASQTSDVLGSRTFTFKTPSPQPLATPLKILIKPSAKPSSSLKPTPIPSISPSPETLTSVNIAQSGNDLNSAVNVWRIARGQGALEADDKVCKAVGERAKEIAGDFSHDKFLDAVKRNDIDYRSISENIAMNSRISVSAVVDQWDKSPHHHEAMIGDFNYGCGAIVGNFAAFILLKK